MGKKGLVFLLPWPWECNPIEHPICVLSADCCAELPKRTPPVGYGGLTDAWNINMTPTARRPILLYYTQYKANWIYTAIYHRLFMNFYEPRCFW